MPKAYVKILFDFEPILKDLDKIGCTSAIQASLIALGLHYLSRRQATPKNKRAAGAHPDNFRALRQFLSLPAPKVPSTFFSIWQFLFRSPPAK